MAFEPTTEKIITDLTTNWFATHPQKVQAAIDRLWKLEADIVDLQEQLGWHQQLPAALRQRAETELGNPGHVWLERAAKFTETGVWPDKE